MKNEILPIVYTAHHASHNYGEFSDRCALNDEQRFRYSDYGTHETIPKNGTVILAEYSRGVTDLNRHDDKKGYIFPDQDYAKPVRNNIWKDGQKPNETEQVEIKNNIYDKYHNQVIEAIEKLDAPTLVVSWDNTAQYVIGENEAGETIEMKPFVLSNRGKEESAYPNGDPSDPVSCDPELLLKVVEIFKSKASSFGLPDEVHLNLVMKGGHITQTYSTLRGNFPDRKYPVQAFQMEYSTAITHDQVTLEPNQPAIENLRQCWEEVMAEAYEWWVAGMNL